MMNETQKAQQEAQAEFERLMAIFAEAQQQMAKVQANLDECVRLAEGR